MKGIQDQLGEIHDCDVWVAWLPEFLTQEQSRMMDYFGHTKPLKRLLPGIQHLVEERKSSRQESYHAFLANWQEIKDENTWEKLQVVLVSSSN
jgi:CHAD domain-containing protein